MKSKWHETLESRNKQLDKWKQIYDGEHKELWGKDLTDEEKEKYVPLNFGRLVVDVISRVLTSKDPHITVQDDNTQDFLDKVIYDNKLKENLGGIIKTGLISSGVLIRTAYGKRNEKQVKSKPMIDIIGLKYYEPIFDPWNITEIKENRLVFESEQDGVKYKKIEIDRYNEYVKELYKKGKEDTDYVLVNSTVQQHTQGFLIQYLPFFNLPNEFWGRSVYLDTEALFKEVNNRLVKILRPMDIFSSPKLMLPAPIFDQLFSDENVHVAPDGTKYVNIGEQDVYRWDADEGSGKPEYLTWDAKIEPALELFRTLLVALALLTDTPVDLLKVGQDGTQTDSGKALKIRFGQTLYRARELSKTLKRGLEQALYQALGLELEFGTENIKQEWVTVNFIQGLPIDEEEVRLEIDKFREGIQSKETTMKKIDNYNERQLAEELKRIEEEEKKFSILNQNFGFNGNLEVGGEDE